jgi:hypothetical protein
MRRGEDFGNERGELGILVGSSPDGRNHR